MRLNRRVILAVVSISALFSIGVVIFTRGDVNSLHLPAKAKLSKTDGLQQSDGFVEHEDGCFYDASCPPPKFLFRIRAETANFPPFACVNDIKLFDGRNVKNGINLVSLNGFTAEIESRASFDVATSDGELIAWLRSLPQSSVIVGVSFGDVAERVSADARALLASFGAVRVADWRETSSYAILGQGGLRQDAHEVVVPHFYEHTQHMIEGCFKVPFGDMVAFNVSDGLSNIQRIDVEKMAALSGSLSANRVVRLGPEWKGCGIPEKCTSDEIPMHFFTGEHKDDWPRLCVGGYMVFDHGLNDAGRGLNLVSIEPKTGRVSSVAHFDTYQDESTALEQWLDNLPLGEILAVVSFDEASNMLSDMAKQILYEMGSSMVQRLKFRASWYFVGHRELAAYSPFEDLNKPSGNSWAKPIKASICVPKKLDSWRGRASNIYLRPHNLPRRHFCLKHDRHGEFCSENSIDNPIRPRALSDATRKGDPVFNMPIVIAAGLSTDSLRISLESLMEQEGLNTQMVVVAYDKEYPENAELSSLFHVKALPVNATDGYNSLLLSAVSAAFYLFPTSPAVAVIEEDVKLSPDWLFYLSQTLPVLLEDKTIDIVQTFNPNGFVDNSGDPSLVYRIDYQPPLYSYVITRDKYESDIRDDPGCCGDPGRWLLASASSLVPDVSRVTIAYSSFGGAEWMNALFKRPRSVVQNSIILDNTFLTQHAYESSMDDMIRSSPVLSVTVTECGVWQKQLHDVLSTSNTTSIVVSCGCDADDLALASRCFGLYSDNLFVGGLYKRVIRFNVNNTAVFIVPIALLRSNGSSFFKF
ncbi:hypothetical protein KIN20_018342 [Parelaphostrongylus tenuis]|uniref:ILEI/PANDER domain-containing protein n=1 Tax=Parelaphostrongylus tenuis TaxID=148309 RepID=A0AAD5QU96_PARTN|nr:hypothetical protein KIN20_018342 [Parelaphostrongylus tenuis]